MKKLLGVIVLLSSASLSFCGGKMNTKANEISEDKINLVLERMQERLDGMSKEELKKVQYLLGGMRCELENMPDEQRKKNAGCIQSLETFIPVVTMIISERQKMAEVDQAKKIVNSV